MTAFELNMDGLVGPTHHYAGLATGNVASTSNALSLANPRAAAHQGINKMRLLSRMGIKQAFIPPHQRPNFHLLHQLGFTGTPNQQITYAKRVAPHLLSASYSASSMWTANAATVSSSLDTKDNRLHFTAANLVSNLHRHQEADFSHQLFKHIFADERYFVHHMMLPKTIITSDEGAANHSRLSAHHSKSGVNLFVYGKRALPAGNSFPAPIRFPARQTLEASEAIARNHLLDLNKVVFACQNPTAIDEGVFHNDVIAVANEEVLLIHEEAFINQKQVLEELQNKSDFPLTIIQISREQMSILDAVNSYLFNSQLITLPTIEKKEMALIAPTECEQSPLIKQIINNILEDSNNPINYVHYLDLKQSMRNGGGPACLRLRVPITELELSAMHQGVLVDEELLNALDKWVDKHYRTELKADDLADPSLYKECFFALDELTSMIGLGSIYPFQINH